MDQFLDQETDIVAPFLFKFELVMLVLVVLVVDILVVLWEGWWSWVVVVGCSVGLCSWLVVIGVDKE